MKTKFRLQKIARYFLYTLLAVVILQSCDYPHHTVCVGKQNMIVYKVEKCNDAKYGTYKYAVTDATGKDWTLYTFETYKVGDTLFISNNR